MIFKELGTSGVKVSILAMGGHEYLPSGKSRGFNEDFARAVKPGNLFEGFGQDRRKSVLRVAYDHGLNFFDVTQDSEKEALGRNLQELPPPYEIYIQTRPEGMVYTYDPFNLKMAQYDLLKAEVQRGLKLLRRDRLDFLNIAFMKSALDHDPEYLDKIRHNITTLKREGLIRFACADTFSGESTYLRQIEAACFDAVYINFNFADQGPKRRVFPEAKRKGLGVIAREAFMKGELFPMGEQADLPDRNLLSQMALRWVLSHSEVTTVVVGTNNPAHLAKNIEGVGTRQLTEQDLSLIRRIKETALYRAYEKRKSEEFFQRD